MGPWLLQTTTWASLLFFGGIAAVSFFSGVAGTDNPFGLPGESPPAYWGWLAGSWGLSALGVTLRSRFQRSTAGISAFRADSGSRQVRHEVPDE